MTLSQLKAFLDNLELTGKRISSPPPYPYELLKKFVDATKVLSASLDVQVSYFKFLEFAAHEKATFLEVSLTVESPQASFFKDWKADTCAQISEKIDLKIDDVKPLIKVSYLTLEHVISILDFQNSARHTYQAFQSFSEEKKSKTLSQFWKSPLSLKEHCLQRLAQAILTENRSFPWERLPASLRSALGNRLHVAQLHINNEKTNKGIQTLLRNLPQFKI